MNFLIEISNLTSTYIIIKVGVTQDLWTVQTRYIAIDQQFPFHVNCFPHITVDKYGALVNISSPKDYQTTYTNNLNYTRLADEFGFTTKNRFTAPLTNYKMAIFWNCVHMVSSSPTMAFYFKIDAKAISSQILQINTWAGIRFEVNRLHMSLVVLDVVGIQSSPNYDIYYAKDEYTQAGGNHYFPVQSQSTFMIGFA